MCKHDASGSTKLFHSLGGRHWILLSGVLLATTASQATISQVPHFMGHSAGGLYYGVGSVLLQNKMLDDYVCGHSIPKGLLIRKLRLRISNRKSKAGEYKDTNKKVDTFSWVFSRDSN